jgi:hypothetical protein
MISDSVDAAAVSIEKATYFSAAYTVSFFTRCSA